MKYTRIERWKMSRICVASVLAICGVSAFGQNQLPPGLFRLPAPAGPSVGPFAPDPSLAWSQLSDDNWTPTAQESKLLQRLASGDAFSRSTLDSSLPREQFNRLNSYLLRKDETQVWVPEHGDASDAATALTFESSSDGPPVATTSGFLTRGDVDFFRIDVRESGTLEVWTSGNIDTVGVVLKNSRPIASNDDESNLSVNFRIVANDVSPGEYYVRVTPYDANAVGFYQIHSSVSPPP